MYVTNTEQIIFPALTMYLENVSSFRNNDVMYFNVFQKLWNKKFSTFLISGNHWLCNNLLLRFCINFPSFNRLFIFYRFQDPIAYSQICNNLYVL